MLCPARCHFPRKAASPGQRVLLEKCTWRVHPGCVRQQVGARASEVSWPHVSSLTFGYNAENALVSSDGPQGVNLVMEISKLDACHVACVT